MKLIFGIIFEIIEEIVEEIVEAAVSFCPPLLIFIIAAFLFFGGGCLAEIFGALLVPLGIIVLIVWLLM